MENSYINFIGYENQDFFPKIEMGLEDCPSYSSMRDEAHGEFSMEKECQNLFLASQKPLDLIHNIFEAAFNPGMTSFEKPKKHLPFTIIRQEKAEKKEEHSTSDETSVSIPIADKIADKSRRIIKREKAKQRNNAKNSATLAPSMSAYEVVDKSQSEGFCQETGDDKSKKKMVQMIRNRISAQNSRDRKKAYMKKLENQQRKLGTDNVHYQKEIKQLKQANEALKIECEHLRRCLMSTISETHDRLYQGEDATDLDYKQDIEFGSDLKSKKGPGGNHLIKYSLALATLFAVVMFSNLNIQNGSPAPAISQLGQQLNAFESKIEEAFSSYRRKLEETSMESDMLDDTEMKIEIENSVSDHRDNLKLSNYSGLDDLKKLKNLFQEDYMSKFMNQLKVNSSSDLEIKEDVTFPQYLKKSLEEQQLNSQTPMNITADNYSALFCPSGFAIQTQEKERTMGSFSVKLEDGLQNDLRRGSKLKKSEWLQLIVPKSNLSPTNFEGQDKLKISNDQGCDSEDNSLIELWCKIVNVKTLQSGF